MKKVFVFVAAVAVLACAASCGNNAKKAAEAAQAQADSIAAAARADSIAAAAAADTAAVDSTVAAE